MVILVPYFMSLNASYKRLIYEGSSTLYIEEASKSTINVAFSLFLLNLTFCTMKSVGAKEMHPERRSEKKYLNGAMLKSK